MRGWGAGQRAPRTWRHTLWVLGLPPDPLAPCLPHQGLLSGRLERVPWPEDVSWVAPLGSCGS